MNLGGLLDRLETDKDMKLAPPAVRDLNFSLLCDRLRQGLKPVGAILFPEGFAPWPGPSFLIKLERKGKNEYIPVCLGHKSLELFRDKFSGIPAFSQTPLEGGKPSQKEPSGLVGEMTSLLGKLEELTPSEKAAAMMDWIMERVEASRCALIPFEGGVQEPPLLRYRGRKGAKRDLKRIPRQIVAYVAHTRQPLISHNVHDPDNVLPPEATVAHMKIRSYMAVPVVFNGNLLAVCYIDRFDRPRRFTLQEQRTFDNFAYELVGPFLTLRNEQRRIDEERFRETSAKGQRRRPVPSGSVSPALREVLERARRLASDPEENILLLGETGVGKEWVAQQVHEYLGTKGPFIAVNLSAFPAELFESELMGTEPGAYTGAVERPGKIAQAEGGILFLDEIGDLPLINQVKLLRIIDDKRITPLGGKDEKAVDVRVIAATNRPLRELVRKGDFREDLYYRFTLPIFVPPLRCRKEEIIPLANSWLERKFERRKGQIPKLTEEAEKFLLSYTWPGNIRELHALMSHALLLISGDEIDRSLLESLLEEQSPPAIPSTALPTNWEEFKALQQAEEKEFLSQYLEMEKGNVKAMEIRLGIPYTTLRGRLEKLGLLQRKK